MFPTFEVVPAVDMQDGEVVQLVQGEKGTETTYGDPVDAAEKWVEGGAETLHLVDLDGAFEGERKNATAVEAILDAVDVDVQLGGGIRTAEDATDLLSRGVDRVILGTAAIENPEIVAEISEEYPGSVMVSLDAKDGEVLVSGWTESTGLDPAEAATRYEELGAGAILFTDVDVEGRMEGVQTGPVRRVAEAVGIPVVASGGVATVEDVRTLRDAGASAVVVGSALYQGAFTLGRSDGRARLAGLSGDVIEDVRRIAEAWFHHDVGSEGSHRCTDEQAWNRPTEEGPDGDQQDASISVSTHVLFGRGINIIASDICRESRTKSPSNGTTLYLRPN